MKNFGERLEAHLASIGMTKYRLYKESGVSESNVNNICKSRRRPTDRILSKFAKSQSLGLSYNQLLAWRALDDYAPDVLDEALNIARIE